MMTLDLVSLSRQATELLEQTLVSRSPGSARHESGVMFATVPTPEFASKDEQHELAVAGCDVVRAALGPAAWLSVSYTVELSVVIGSTDQRLGIDIERLAPARPRIAERVLTASELGTLGPALAWLDVLRCFCMKEAAYKALPESEQVGLGFRGLQLEEPWAECSRVQRTDDLRFVAVAAAAHAAQLLVAIART